MPELKRKKFLTRSEAAGVMTVNVKGRLVLDEAAMLENKTFEKQFRAARILGQALRNLKKPK